MIPWNLHRQVRKLFGVFFIRRHSRKQMIFVTRLVAIVTICLVTVAFVTPARNLVGYYFIPSTWVPLSSGRIIQMFFIEEQRVPVEVGDDVTCTAVEDLLSKVNWMSIIYGVDQLPAYDDRYYSNLASNPDIYGTTPEEVEILSQKFPYFKPPMSGTWQRRLRLTFKVFYLAMNLFNVTYFLTEGSMLGAYRHHGYIPWDDDMDICMNGTDWLKVKQILHCIPGFDVDTRNYMMYKFFWTNSEPMKSDASIHVPYIDIFFFTEDPEYIWALSSIKKHRIVFKKDEIFPLTHRPFEDLTVPLPRKFEDLCTSMYNPTTCVSRDYDHFKDRPLIPFYEYEYKSCDFLKKFYPFVERHKLYVEGKIATVEVKKLGNKVLSNFTVFH